MLRASAQARTTLSLLKRVFDDSSDGIVIFKSDGTVLRHSYSAQAMFGVDDTGTLLLPDKLRKLALGTAVPQGNDTLPPQLIEVETGGERRLLEYRATKSEVELSQGFGDAPEPEKITTLVVRDITQIKEQEQDIAYLSNYDDRTGALRRGAFLAFLGLRLEEERGVIVFALTLDRLKTINVTLGRAVGDALLKEVVARIERSPLHLSAVVRLGGTNFAFYTEGAFEPEKSHQLAQAVLHEVAQPYRLENVNAQIDARIGYTCVEEDSETTAALALEQAEEAMDATKQIGAPIASYDHSAWEKQRRARQIERAMEGALANNEFNLLYQPQHDVTDGRLVGAEALIRWDSPVFGMVSPDEFITIAESTGFIVEIGKWTLEQAATDALTLPSDMTIAVNVSGIQIMRSDFARDVDAILRKVGVPANRICLELTETVFLASTSSIIETMQDVSFLGITWALDDFGTGFSSMKYLSKMPLDKVKLDKSFTMKLGQDPSARPILHSTSELCRGLGVKLLCEGVETQEQLGVLLEEGCAEAQGYFFGKPMPVDQLVPNAQIARERQLS